VDHIYVLFSEPTIVSDDPSENSDSDVHRADLPDHSAQCQPYLLLSHVRNLELLG
jgi:hypothetical protein